MGARLRLTYIDAIWRDKVDQMNRRRETDIGHESILAFLVSFAVAAFVSSLR